MSTLTAPSSVNNPPGGGGAVVSDPVPLFLSPAAWSDGEAAQGAVTTAATLLPDPNYGGAMTWLFGSSVPTGTGLVMLDVPADATTCTIKLAGSGTDTQADTNVFMRLSGRALDALTWSSFDLNAIPTSAPGMQYAEHTGLFLGAVGMVAGQPAILQISRSADLIYDSYDGDWVMCYFKISFSP